MPSALIELFRRWFEYEKDAHRRVLESLETVPEEARGSEPYRKAMDLMGHIVAARRTWLHRMKPTFERAAAIFPTGVTREALLAELEVVERAWTDFLGRLTEPDLAGDLTYRTTEGDWYRTGVVDILQHAYGHSLYHRGQIATLVRAAGGRPASTDLILWAREPAEPTPSD